MKLTKKHKIISICLAFFLVIGIGGISYAVSQYQGEQARLQEIENIKIDEYNFEQLEKVKAVIDPLGDADYRFRNLEEFNEKFDQDIEPIKNCYFIGNKNGFKDSSTKGGGYIFGFLLESQKYIEQYGDKYFSYPEYDLPEVLVCDSVSCDDWNRGGFEFTISNPCE